MAIPNNYIDKITDKDQNESRLICPAAEHVRIENENFEADNLDEVLDELAEGIDDAGQVNEIIMNGQHYTPTDKVIDLGTVITQLQDISGKVDKEQGKGLSTNDYTTAEKDKLDALPTSTELDTQLGEKADKTTTYTKTETDVAIADAVEGLGVGTVQSVSVNGGTPSMPNQNGNVNINVQDGGLTKEDISVETQGGGIVDINVADDTYKINLNHTHENMAKLIVVDDEEDLPAQLAADTIYGVSDGEEISVVYIGGLPFYGGGGGGGSTSPVLREPSNNSTINVGTNTGSGVSKSITVKGRNLTQDLTLELTGTGFAFDSTQATGVTVVSSTELTVSATAANQTGGVAVVVKYTGTSVSASCQLEITSTGEINVACTLTASYEMPDQSYNEAEAKAAFQDSTLNNKWLNAAASAIGSAPAYTNDVAGTKGCYILKIPLAGVAVLRYPMFVSSGGFGSVVCDANGIVLWSFTNKNASDGALNTIDVKRITGASYALIQLYNAISNYTVELSGDLYYGISTDKAMAASGEVTAVGYSVTNPYPFVNGHTYKIAAGFTQSPSGTLYGILFGQTLYSVDNNQDGNGLMSFTASPGTSYGKVTLKTSEIDDCYIYDDTDDVYLFKGKNVQ